MGGLDVFMFRVLLLLKCGHDYSRNIMCNLYLEEVVKEYIKSQSTSFGT
jgi:hypothetical protein